MPPAVFRIGELSRRTGVSPDLIRVWERRYGLLRPTRSDGNFRLYSRDDVARLRLMRHYLAQNIQPSRAAQLVEQARAASLRSNPGVPRSEVRMALGVLRESLERYDEGPAEQLLVRLLGVFSAGAVLRDIVLPYLNDLGERWQCAEVSVAQEHFASRYLEAWMLTLAAKRGRTSERCAVLACLPGELHTLGLIAFGVALQDLGWRVVYLGGDTPLPSVEQAAAAVEPDAVVLSAAIPATFGAIADEIAQLAEVHSIALGGAGVAGADSFSSFVLPGDVLTAAQALALRPSAQAKGRQLDRWNRPRSHRR